MAFMLRWDGQASKDKTAAGGGIGAGRTGLLQHIGDAKSTRQRPAGDDCQRRQYHQRRHHDLW